MIFPNLASSSRMILVVSQELSSTTTALEATDDLPEKEKNRKTVVTIMNEAVETLVA